MNPPIEHAKIPTSCESCKIEMERKITNLYRQAMVYTRCPSCGNSESITVDHPLPKPDNWDYKKSHFVDVYIKASEPKEISQIRRLLVQHSKAPLKVIFEKCKINGGKWPVGKLSLLDVEEFTERAANYGLSLIVNELR